MFVSPMRQVKTLHPSAASLCPLSLCPASRQVCPLLLSILGAAADSGCEHANIFQASAPFSQALQFSETISLYFFTLLQGLERGKKKNSSLCLSLSARLRRSSVISLSLVLPVSPYQSEICQPFF